MPDVEEQEKCSLILSNGTRFTGRLIGAPLNASGELVFTTGMVGYTEAITDPSYYGQILLFTYPLIGNYGVPEMPSEPDKDIPRGFESNKPQAAAVICSTDSKETFHWNSVQSLDQWLKSNNVPGIIDLDTRHLVHLIRSQPRLLGRIEPHVSKGYRYSGQQLGTPTHTDFYDSHKHNVIREVSRLSRLMLGQGKKRIALVDCGVKWNIVRQLLKFECEIELLPWDSDFDSVDCDGWLISNGPGDPTKTGQLVQDIKKIFEQEKPLLGICLGHQLIALAAGATTSRMPYGHRSHNQPVYEVGTRTGYMTTQNHGYVVDSESIKGDWEPWFRNINDQSIEGLRHKNKPFRTVQFHPEACGGPHDTAWVLNQFASEVIR